MDITSLRVIKKDQIHVAYPQPIVGILFVSIAAAVAILVAQILHLTWIVQWAERSTRGMRYYGRSASERRRFKKWLRVNARILAPILRVTSYLTNLRFSQCSFDYLGVSGPRGACCRGSFQRASEYQPDASDIFVVTQMKCGTTWMLHVVLQLLTRGDADLVSDERPLNAVSPWLGTLNHVMERPYGRGNGLRYLVAFFQRHVAMATHRQSCRPGWGQ